MEIKFADSFFESLKTLNRHQTWWYKTYRFFTYNLPEFFKNIYRFRKELYQHRWWDYAFTLSVFKRSLEIQYKGMEENGSENKKTLHKKLAKMKRAIKILENREADVYIELAEQKLGKLHDWDIINDNLTDYEHDHNKNVYSLASELEKQEWTEFWEILEGQDYESYDKEKHGDFDDWYDGSGILGWWD